MTYFAATEYSIDSFLQGCKTILARFGMHIKDHVVPHPRNGYKPHMLHHRSIGLMSLLLVTVKVSVLVVTAFTVANPAFSSAITTQNVLSLTNDSRKTENLAALTYDVQLERAAQAKADDMLAKGYFAHTSPDGRSPWDFIKAAGFSYIAAGENLAVGFPKDCAECVEDAWMKSPGHRANIMNKYFEKIGVGISQGLYEGQEAVFVVQMFGTPISDTVTVQNQPTVVQKAPTPKPATIPQTTTPAPSTKNVAPQPVAPVSNTSPTPKPSTVTPKGVAGLAPVPTAQTPVLEDLKIISHTVAVQNNYVHITVKTSNSASKVTATFGEKAALLRPTGDNSWKASIPLSLMKNNALSIVAQNVKGDRVSEQVANFAQDLQTAFNPTGAGDVKGESITVFGRTFQPKAVEKQFYLLFVATILTCLVIAIAVRRHIQHLSLVANSSFVVVLAMLLWLG